jgi:putative FmdB family regulatory protein
VPVYEYLCRDCDVVFEARRPMADADLAVACPAGHERVARRLSVFATTGRAATADRAGAGSMGAPCGPACACHPG